MPIIDPTKEVQIMSKNCIDSYSTIVSSHGGTVSRLYDRDKSLQWQSSGANRDEISVILTVTFNVVSTETEFTFNRLMILNTNVKDFILEWWKASDSTWHSVVNAGIAENAGYTCFSFGAVKSSRIKLTLVNTQPHNKEKMIGQIVICRVLHVMSEGLTDYRINYSQKISQYEVGDGGLQIAYTRSPGSRVNRYGASATFTLLPRSDYEFLRCLKDEGEPFIWYPEAVTRPDEVWFVHWVNPITAFYTTTFTGAGYTLVMELSEV